MHEGLIVKRSRETPATTVERLRSGLSARGIRVFAEIDHSSAAAEVGLHLPAETVIALLDSLTENAAVADDQTAGSTTT